MWLSKKRTYEVYSDASGEYKGNVLAPNQKEAKRMGMMKYGFKTIKSVKVVLK